ncbi:type IX secretion system membrane protein PorP/SprF [Sphingobacterium sp. SGG-5]|uniref:PorP/SprF family type IX secretion system membrane protein n=1 Tax=Sphingobacterium sp. SGG-5 TaxID=2710881 RepID=UPI0013EA2F40|nr:PorP/SprF family type IX secretion system membrane protein [Sphingobacterium sp. SGG-5]NGM63091.1 type IX secretion system membrane protein PorP/SprF [Sphingobacterium sp. SGG-5]
MKRYFNILLYIAVLLPFPYFGKAQHGLSYNQFGQLRNSFNGSLSLMDPDGGAALLSRWQWAELDGAPKAYWASGHVGIQRLGITVGADVKQVNIGVVRDRELSGYIASAVRLGEDEYIGLSVGGGILMHAGNYSKLDPSDPSFAQDIQQSQGIVSLGTSYFRENKYYVGISVPRFMLSRNKNDLDYDFRQVYYITAGALFQVDEGFHIRPSCIVSQMESIGPRFDANVLAFFARKFGLGVGIQSQGDVSGLLQFNVGNFGVGYSYQINPGATTSNRRISNNTHEIGLKYRVGGMKML